MSLVWFLANSWWFWSDLSSLRKFVFVRKWSWLSFKELCEFILALRYQKQFGWVWLCAYVFRLLLFIWGNWETQFYLILVFFLMTILMTIIMDHIFQILWLKICRKNIKFLQPYPSLLVSKSVWLVHRTNHTRSLNKVHVVWMHK